MPSVLKLGKETVQNKNKVGECQDKVGLCLVPKFLSPNFTIHLSHQIFCLMYGALNVGK